MNQSAIEEMLRNSLSDGKLSRAEKSSLKAILEQEADRPHERDWVRNRTFEIARASLIGPDAIKTVDWLEDVAAVLLLAERPSAAKPGQPLHDVCFSPGDACRLRIQDLLREARTTVEICVFTITDDRITDGILDAAARGVHVRVISDNDKAFDPGSDMSRLRDMRVPVRVDDSPNHMHHKFAVFDGSTAVSGSYNWTRSAADQNEENIVITNEPKIVAAFRHRFETLWKKFA